MKQLLILILIPFLGCAQKEVKPKSVVKTPAPVLTKYQRDSIEVSYQHERDVWNAKADTIFRLIDKCTYKLKAYNDSMLKNKARAANCVDVDSNCFKAYTLRYGLFKDSFHYQQDIIDSLHRKAFNYSISIR